jgi:hypothetical protein
MPSVAEELQRQQRAQGLGRRQLLGAGKPGLLKHSLQRDLRQIRHKQEESAELGTKVPWGQIQLPHIGHRGRFRTRPLGTFLIGAAREPGEAGILE